MKSRLATLDAWLREYGREAVTPTARLPAIDKQLAGE